MESSADRPWKIVSSRTAKAEIGPQNQRLIPGVTTALAGSTQLSAGLVVMPAGGVSKAHIHHKYELIIFIIEGWAATLLGPNLEPAIQGPGDFLFIPAGVEHLAVNLSTEERVVGIETRADPQFNEDVELLPQLNDKATSIIEDIRRRHAAGDLPANWKQLPSGPFNYQES